MHRPCSKCKITYYCSVICQKHHWKEGGHKKHCVAKEERSASAAASAAAAEEEDDGGGAGASGGGSSTAKAKKKATRQGQRVRHLPRGPRRSRVRPCADPRLHAPLPQGVRGGAAERGVQQACPMCRAKLPDSAEKMFDDACTIYFPIKRRVEQGEGPWGPLSRRQQRQMDEVVRLWEGAAEQGHANAQYNLGIMYDHGHGVDVNYKKAIEWYEKAAEQGYAKAQYNLGVMYDHGQGVDVNYKKAIEWYEKAAKRSRWLSIIWVSCNGLADVNYKKAIEWYEKAAEHAWLMCVDVNYKKAIEWWRRAIPWRSVYREGGGAGIEWYEKAAQVLS